MSWVEKYINNGDFVGEISLPTNDTSQLRPYINRVGKEVMRDLLGITLYRTFETNVQLATPDTRWTDLLNGKDYENESGEDSYFEGMLKAIRYFIYADYLEKNYIETFSGSKNRETDNTTTTDLTQQNKYKNDTYNKGVTTYITALPFLKADLTSYDGFKYKRKTKRNQTIY